MLEINLAKLLLMYVDGHKIFAQKLGLQKLWSDKQS